MSNNSIKGGGFIIHETFANDIFIPEEWNEEQQMISQVCEDFIEKEIIPVLDRIDAQEEGLMQSLLDKAGELGLLGITVPVEYGGMENDFKTSLLATEHLGKGHSFSVAYGAHTGIGTLPLMYYGNERQKTKYLAKLVSGEWKAAYCLTEPDAGSDANSGKTKANLSDDGKHYIISGQKMWITNGGFADLLTVFAKIDDDEVLSAFLVERSFEGISFNPEEHKMGIKGSSTRQIFFNQVKVPVENLLSERKNGFKIALNILNIGRVKLGAGVLGGSKQTFQHSIQYSIEREQFGRSISKYGAIQQKIADQFIKIFVLESAVYRTGQAIDDKIIQNQKDGMDKNISTLKGIENFAIECAIIKVAGSECLDFVVDEAVQIYGGMGYSSESPVERSYRDSRINRIFEGTNEINRLLIVDMLLKKGLKGELDLMSVAKSIQTELMSIPEFGESNDEFLIAEKKTLLQLKKIVWMITGSVVQKLMQTLSKEQEILLSISDCLINIYQAESALLRVEKLHDKQDMQNDIRFLLAQTYLYDSVDFIHKKAKDVILSFAEGDEASMLLMGLKRFAKYKNINPKENRKLIAKFALEKGKYIF
ncbi:MAG: acyl-CoA dehydrogenase family protein [Flavobacteriia bacterium]|nr:acyl-CoA dehydrogenase family protein [Flavobacteriia bacterium]